MQSSPTRSVLFLESVVAEEEIHAIEAGLPMFGHTNGGRHCGVKQSTVLGNYA